RDSTQRVEVSIRRRSADDHCLKSDERAAHYGLPLPEGRFADARSAVSIDKLYEAPDGLRRNAKLIPPYCFDHGFNHESLTSCATKHHSRASYGWTRFDQLAHQRMARSADN